MGQTVRINVSASDDVAVASLGLEIDGVSQSLDANNGVFYTPATGGLPQIIATATDTSGNVGTGTPNPPLRVIDPNDDEPPVVEIVAPAPGTTITYLTDIIGTVSDADGNLEFYELQYALAGTDEFVTVSRSNGEVTDGLLGVFDPTLLANDAYDVRILAQDTNGQQSFQQIEVYVEAQAKLGNFRLEFTDLEIPLAGIPIQINRIYDTLEANLSGDFGFGWSLGLYSPRIRETVRVSAGRASWRGPVRRQPVPPGNPRLPDRPRRSPRRLHVRSRSRGGTPGNGVAPSLRSRSGRVRSTAGRGCTAQQNADGTFWLYLFGFTYNPDEYTLVTKDQREFRIHQFDGLQDITDRNGVMLSFEDDGVFSSTGQSITWVRDAAGTHHGDHRSGRELDSLQLRWLRRADRRHRPGLQSDEDVLSGSARPTIWTKSSIRLTSSSARRPTTKMAAYRRSSMRWATPSRRRTMWTTTPRSSSTV